MPMAVPLVASAFSISAGLTAGGMLGGLMVAGGALSGLGAITGNKKLSGFGALLGLAAGVGSFASKALEEGAKTAVTDAAGKAASDAAAATAGNTIADATGTAVGATEAAKAASSSALDAGSALAGDVASADAASINSALTPAKQAMTSGANPLDGRLADGLASSPKTPGLIERVTNAVGSNAAGDMATGAKNVLGTLWDAGTGAVKSAGAWAEANPTTAKLAGGLVGGAMTYMGQQEATKEAIRQRRKYEDWARQRYNDSVAGLQVPAPFSTARPPQGIIAGSRG